MKKLSIAALALGMIIPTVTLAQSSVGDVIGTTEQGVRAALVNLGFVIDELEVESGEIEVDASRGGESFEFEVSTATGAITEIELDDDDGSDDRDDDSDDDNDDDHDND